MSNAIAQSATKLAVTTTGGEDDFDIATCVARNAERTAKGATREARLLNYNKLISSTCRDYRMHFPAIYSKTDTLPKEVFNKIEKSVTDYISSKLSQVNVTNVLSFKRGFYHKSQEMEVVERVISTGENKLHMKEQLLGIDIFITSAEKRLKDLEAKPTPDYDREKSVRAQIMKLNFTRDYIKGEISRQEKLITPAPETK